MPLKLRPTGLGSGSTRTGLITLSLWRVGFGRIDETRGGPEILRWFWSLTVNAPMTRSDRVATLEEAKAHFRKAGTLEGVGEDGRGGVTRLEQRGGVALAVVIFIALVIAVWGWL